MTVNFNQNNQPSPERVFTSKTMEELFWIIGDIEFLRIILKDEIEQQIIFKRWKENKSFPLIAIETSLTLFEVTSRYKKIVKKLKGSIKRFINFYIKNNTEDSKEVKEKKKLNETKNLVRKDVLDIEISDLLSNKPKWASALKAHGILTLGQMQKYTIKEVSLIESIGPLAMQEIDFLMNYYNLSFKKSLREISF